MYLHIIVASAIATGASAGVTSGDGPASQSHVAPTVSVSTDALEDLLRILRDLFIRIGGDPGVLSDHAPPELWYTTITAYYTLHGVPGDLTPAEQAGTRAIIAQTYSSVSASTSIVGFVPTLLFKATLKSMYTDLGGNPADLG